MQATHPDEQTLKAYGLGKLDDGPATTVNDHLETCEECRQKLSGLTSDSFLGKFRDARQPMARSMFGGSLVDGTVSFLQAKATAAPPPTDTIPPGLANHPDYEIRRELGRGGMGVVYLAHNTMMGRDEVLKVMGRHIMERPGVLERFQREIRAVAKLRHPNIVAAYHAFRIEGGLVFSMEYVEGLDLARLVKAKGPLSVSHAAYFVHQAALGLQHAHEKGLIHRDIKPHNLMLTHDGKARLVKVLDFGLAKATREEKIDGGLTSEGQALGTPDYIAPEQITNAPDVDIRADIYSLGGTLFYLLTGRPPFQAASLYDIYQAHMSRDAEPLNLIRPEVPAELAALVAKMMAKEPKRRFQTPAEVAQALTPYFKRANSPPRSSKGEISHPVPPIAPKPAAEKPRVSPPNTTKPMEGKALWESLIEVQTPDPLLVQARVSASRQRPPWASKTLAIAASFFVLMALGIIIIIVKRDNGRETKIVIENTPAGKPITEPLQREILALETKIVKSEPPTSHFVPLFNGKDLEGWTDNLANGSRWSVNESGILEGVGNGQGNPAVLVSQRQDFVNFRLRVKFRHTQASFGWFELRRTTTGTDTSGYFVMHGEDEDLAGMASVSPAHNYKYGGPFNWKWKADRVSPDVDRWYLMEISLIGNRLTTSIDGKKAVEVVDVDEKYRKGAIALSASGGASVQFQEVLIEELPDGYQGTRASGSPVASTVPGMSGLTGLEADKVANVPGMVNSKSISDSSSTPVLDRRRRTSGGDWAVDGDELIQSSLEGATRIMLVDQPVSRFEIRFQVKLTSGPGGFWTTFHDKWLDDKHMFEYFEVGRSVQTKTKIAFFKGRKWGMASHDLDSEFQPVAGIWYNVRVVVRDAEFRCYVDELEIFHSSNDDFTSGCVTIGTTRSTACFRDIKVTSPDGKVLWEGVPEVRNH